MTSRARQVSDLRVRPSSARLSLSDYNTLLDASDHLVKGPWRSVVDEVRRLTSARSIFFLAKGPLALDSRRHIGLACEIRIDEAPTRVTVGEPARYSLGISNTGSARWLSHNTEIFGIVRVGTHLFSDDGRLIELDHSRHAIPADVRPGEFVDVSVALPAIEVEGRYEVVFDLVAEGVTWFENVGARPARAWLIVTSAPDHRIG